MNNVRKDQLEEYSRWNLKGYGYDIPNTIISFSVIAPVDWIDLYDWLYEMY